MATPTFVNRARMLTSTTGTGSSITLTTAVDKYFSFAEAGLQNGDVVDYVIEDGNDFEIQVGQTYNSAGPSLSRGTPAASKVGGVAGTSQINLAGNAQVFITAVAESFDISRYTEQTIITEDDLLLGHSDADGERRKFPIGSVLGLVPSPIQVGTAQAVSTSTSAVSFTGLPAGLKRVTLMFDGISLTDNNHFLIQIGTSSGFQTTGYSAAAIISASAMPVAITSTSGFPMGSNAAQREWSGMATLARLTGDTWVCSHAHGTSSGLAGTGGGTKNLGAELDRIRLTGTSGNIDAGTLNVMYE